MSESLSAKFPPLVSREHAGNVIGHALRLFVGRGRRYSVKQLSNATGVPDRTIECAMADNVDHRSLPDWALLSLTAFLGADFTNEWLKLAHQGAFELSDDEPDPGDLAADTAEDTAKVVRMAKDNRFDEDEKPALKGVGARMVKRGQTLLSVAAA